MEDFESDTQAQETEREIKNQLSDHTADQLLELLAAVLTKDLVAKIMSGTASPSDRNTARQLLRDNGVELNTENPDVFNLEEALKGVEFNDEEDDPTGSGETQGLPSVSLPRLAGTRATGTD